MMQQQLKTLKALHPLLPTRYSHPMTLPLTSPYQKIHPPGPDAMPTSHQTPNLDQLSMQPILTPTAQPTKACE